MSTGIEQEKRATQKRGRRVGSCQRAYAITAGYVKEMVAEGRLTSKRSAAEAHYREMVSRYGRANPSFGIADARWLAVCDEVRSLAANDLPLNDDLLYLKSVLLALAELPGFNIDDLLRYADVIQRSNSQQDRCALNLPRTKKQQQALARDVQLRFAAAQYANTSRPHQLALLFSAAIKFSALRPRAPRPRPLIYISDAWWGEGHEIISLIDDMHDDDVCFPTNERQLNRIFARDMNNIPRFAELKKRMAAWSRAA